MKNKKIIARITLLISSFLVSLCFYYIGTQAFWLANTLSPVGSAILCGTSMAIGGLLLFIAMYLIVSSDLALIISVSVTSTLIVSLLIIDSDRNQITTIPNVIITIPQK